MLGPEWHDDVSRLAHMGFTTRPWQGLPIRLLRASFSGELAFELHCRPAHALTLWETLVRLGMTPYGIEAVDILRLEKGYFVGAELSGQTSPYDLEMDSFVALGNACIGREMLNRPGLHEISRPKIVGLRAADGRAKILAGAQLTTEDDRCKAVGYVTSSVYSPALGEWIALALLARQHAARPGVLLAQDPLRGGEAAVRVTKPTHFDPNGERMKI